jgi:hypothetical protein
MARNDKKLKQKSGDPGKGRIASPVMASDTSHQLEHPIFCLRYLSKDYSISQCKTEDKAAFADTIGKLSQLTWQQIYLADRHGCGFEKISRNAIKPSIPPNITEDVKFIAFRFRSMAPMIGYRDSSIFRVVWIDPHFKVYSHG